MSLLKLILKKFYNKLYYDKKINHNRSLSLGDYINDRWERAKKEGFGEGTSVYDNVLILGDVKVGKHCWIGPNVVLDGSGGLEIGDYVHVSAGAQIYTHHTVKFATFEPLASAERLSKVSTPYMVVKQIIRIYQKISTVRYV